MKFAIGDKVKVVNREQGVPFNFIGETGEIMFIYGNGRYLVEFEGIGKRNFGEHHLQLAGSEELDIGTLVEVKKPGHYRRNQRSRIRMIKEKDGRPLYGVQFIVDETSWFIAEELRVVPESEIREEARVIPPAPQMYGRVWAGLSLEIGKKPSLHASFVEDTIRSAEEDGYRLIRVDRIAFSPDQYENKPRLKMTIELLVEKKES